MVYKEKVTVCSEIHTKHINAYDVNTMQNFRMLNLVVRNVT